MKTIAAAERERIIGPYTAPLGLYDYTKSLPFLGTVTTDITSLVAGQWAEINILYTVGASGLADGAWIKGTFKFYSVSSRWVFVYFHFQLLILSGLGTIPDIQSKRRQLHLGIVCCRSSGSRPDRGNRTRFSHPFRSKRS
jgi:hypothetical protein